ncbi:hypothetical protein CEXT_215711 [Caerostris extrusa]|uniref:Uncharacterized protein n=1 Tax=Caerostris extrusa TaxID=172846 RepID=A0AAV4P9D4_CAEEX|nr:hypothetical protein CEXT_215711 [Caerostris extrusa]
MDVTDKRCGWDISTKSATGLGCGDHSKSTFCRERKKKSIQKRKQNCNRHSIPFQHSVQATPNRHMPDPVRGRMKRARTNSTGTLQSGKPTASDTSFVLVHFPHSSPQEFCPVDPNHS